MKKIYLAFFPCFSIFFCACQPKVDIEKETEAIKAVITDETRAYMQNDTAKVLSYYLQDDYQTRASASCDTFRIYRGWGEVSAIFKKIDLSAYSNPRNSKDFIQVKVMGNAAWAIYKETWEYGRIVKAVAVPGGMKDTIITRTSTLLCTMNLEKKMNEWKISSFSLFSLR